MARNLLACGNILLELGNQLTLIVVETTSVGESLDAWKWLAVGVGELPCPSLEAGQLRTLGPNDREHALIARAAPTKPAW